MSHLMPSADRIAILIEKRDQLFGCGGFNANIREAIYSGRGWQRVNHAVGRSDYIGMKGTMIIEQ